VVGLLVGLAIFVRGGPTTAYGYVVNATPRRRRRVRPWVLTVLRPFFVYNHHRDAYVLRGVGNRVGPVLRRREERGERRDGLPPVRRTGRFQRIEVEPPPIPEPPPPEPVAVARKPEPPAGKRAKRSSGKGPKGQGGKPGNKQRRSGGPQGGGGKKKSGKRDG
jgi:uncharacterized membrane protein YgcG